ncbi:hypothetical protein FQR65_LT16146 [Abscondita terminalis]|nr:hypothetical protein FQR65_LT16146 [Abscondita terminalis]
MSSSNEGLQFTVHPETQKSSSSQVGKEIIAEALSLVDNINAQKVLDEKNWRKNYPIYFKALVENGIQSTHNAITIAKQGLHKAQHSFDFFRDGQRYSLKDVMSVPLLDKIQTITIKGQSDAQPEWFVPYHGQKLSGEALLKQIQTWQEAGIIETSHADALREVVAHPEWFDLSDLLGLLRAALESRSLTGCPNGKANIVAIDLPNERVWEKSTHTIQQVVEQGPNYALAKRIQQWRATLARHQGQHVSINIAPSTTTHSVTKNPLLKAAFNGASLFDVEAFSPETTNSIMAALWIHDLKNPNSVANPATQMEHPLELMMEGANHGGLWRVAYLARTALPFAAIYGFATDKLPIQKILGKTKK